MTTNDSETDDRSYILIRKGISLRTIDELRNGGIETKISRSRGGAEVITPPEKKESQTESGTPNDNHMGVVKFHEGVLITETNYCMHFVPSKTIRSLPVYDIVSLLEQKAYPVKNTTLNSLPDWAISKLKSNGDIKIKAEYNPSDATFSNVSDGWTKSANPFDETLELAEKLDGNLIKSLYYMAARNASDDWKTPKEIAKVRDVKPETVEQAIRDVERQIEKENNN